MAHGDDSGDRAGSDGAGDALQVESPQILERSAAPREQHHVCPDLLDPAQGVPNLGFGLVALNAHGQERDGQRWETAFDHVQDVLQSGA